MNLEGSIELIHGDSSLIADAAALLQARGIDVQERAVDGATLYVAPDTESRARHILEAQLSVEGIERSATLRRRELPIYNADGQQLEADKALLIRTRFPQEGRTTWFDGYRIELYSGKQYVTDLANGYDSLAAAMEDAARDLELGVNDWRPA